MKKLSFPLIATLLGVWMISCEEDSGVTCNDNFQVNTTNVSNALCGESNGSFSLTTSGQNGTVTYQLDNGSFQSSAEFTDLAPGTYQVTAKDENGCTATSSVNITNEDVDLGLNVSSTNSECGKQEGSLTVEASEGEAPYQYSLDGTNFQTENQFASLEPGEYMVTVRDSKGCTGETTAVVHSGISFSNTISSIISTNCAVDGCHNGSRNIPNFTTKSVIFDLASRIKERTSAKTMPPPGSGHSLTDAEIQQIACWVDDGAPDN